MSHLDKLQKTNKRRLRKPSTWLAWPSTVYPCVHIYLNQDNIFSFIYQLFALFLLRKRIRATKRTKAAVAKSDTAEDTIFVCCCSDSIHWADDNVNGRHRCRTGPQPGNRVWRLRTGKTTNKKRQMKLSINSVGSWDKHKIRPTKPRSRTLRIFWLASARYFSATSERSATTAATTTLPHKPKICTTDGGSAQFLSSVCTI